MEMAAAYERKKKKKKVLTLLDNCWKMFEFR